MSREEKPKRRKPGEARVPMRCTGADRFVLAMKAREWGWSKGIGVGGCAITSTGDRRKVCSRRKQLFNIEAIWWAMIESCV